MHEGAVEDAMLLEAQAFIDVVAGGEGVVSGGHSRTVGGSGVSDDDRGPLFVLCRQWPSSSVPHHSRHRIWIDQTTGWCRFRRREFGRALGWRGLLADPDGASVPASSYVDVD